MFEEASFVSAIAAWDMDYKVKKIDWLIY